MFLELNHTGHTKLHKCIAVDQSGTETWVDDFRCANQPTMPPCPDPICSGKDPLYAKLIAGDDIGLKQYSTSKTLVVANTI